jgi:four helix bundle protein
VKQGEKGSYDLEERTFRFAREVATYCRSLPSNASNTEYTKQLIRSSGSVGSNYIEANEALGKKDFVMRIRISRKEAKESAYWLRLIGETNANGLREEASRLRSEAIELKRIYSSILNKLK